MQKLVIALTAMAAFSGPALAADMAAKAPMRAAPVAYAPSWTGCYIGGGGGYSMYNAETRQVDPTTGAFVAHQGDAGGRGYFGNVQVGCDYQFGGNFVFGAFGDYSFMDVDGDKIGPPLVFGVGSLKQDSAWAVGGRVGYLITPSVLSYFSGGWTQSHFDQVNYRNPLTLALSGTALPGATYDGWFLGSGIEHSLSFLPGLYLKTEYRFSQFERKQLNNIVTATGAASGTAETVKPYTHSVLTSLVYRFNWGGAPVSGRY
ncbi:outer membrane beta-barrel protein [Bradyrhizobium sp.]|uniref:outer membrane protein n=1 Tax=Bradyrhizobium sp. TaxID=376 RepID=UPI0025B97234|nr:outer membrane beta-barrel protein [Bradyrhizobium sp.]